MIALSDSGNVQFAVNNSVQLVAQIAALQKQLAENRKVSFRVTCGSLSCWPCKARDADVVSVVSCRPGLYEPMFMSGALQSSPEVPSASPSPTPPEEVLRTLSPLVASLPLRQQPPITPSPKASRRVSVAFFLMLPEVIEVFIHSTRSSLGVFLIMNNVPVLHGLINPAREPFVPPTFKVSPSIAALWLIGLARKRW